jgi:hypothetical protein
MDDSNYPKIKKYSNFAGPANEPTMRRHTFAERIQSQKYVRRHAGTFSSLEDRNCGWFFGFKSF